MIGHSPDESVAAIAAKVAPPVAVSTMTILGVHVSDIAMILTALYTALNIFFLVRDKIYRPWKTRRR